MIHSVWGAPIIIIVVTALLWQQIQWATFVGLAVNLILVPFTAFVAKRLARLRREIVGYTDKRTSTMDEVINGMRVIKFYAWEVPFRCALGCCMSPQCTHSTSSSACGFSFSPLKHVELSSCSCAANSSTMWRRSWFTQLRIMMLRHLRITRDSSMQAAGGRFSCGGGQALEEDCVATGPLQPCALRWPSLCQHHLVHGL
jgi:ABC transporter transmembrane region